MNLVAAEAEDEARGHIKIYAALHSAGQSTTEHEDRATQVAKLLGSAPETRPRLIQVGEELADACVAAVDVLSKPPTTAGRTWIAGSASATTASKSRRANAASIRCTISHGSPPSPSPLSPPPPPGRLDVEAEHHSALVMLGDVAVGHPTPDMCHVQQDVNGLPRTRRRAPCPSTPGLARHTPSRGEDEEPTRTVDVKGVVHRVVPCHLVE